MIFEDAVANAPVILTEGAVIERLRRDPAVELDPQIANAGLKLRMDEPDVAAALCDEAEAYTMGFQGEILEVPMSWFADQLENLRAELPQ